MISGRDEASGIYGRKNQAIMLGMALLIITISVYLPLGNCQFLNFDDPVYVTENRHIISGISMKNVMWAFTSFEAGNWHPVTWLSHMTDVRIYGMAPRGHHLSSLGIHALATLLLFMLLYRMTSAPWQSSFVAALFALHPVHVESVAWVAERKDVLSAFFGFLTLFIYVKFTENRKTTLYLSALLAFIAGLMAKPMLVTLPAVMLLLDYWPLCRSRQTMSPMKELFLLIKEKTPFILCSLCSGIITIYAQKSGGAVAALSAIPLSLRIENSLIAYVSYIGKLIYPKGLAIYYPMPVYNARWQVAGALVLLLGISAAAVLIRRRAPWVAVGWFWFVITLIPVIGIVQVGSQLMADRYTYIPAIGLFMTAAWGIPATIRNIRLKKTILATLYAAAIIISIVVTRQQLTYWNNNIDLYKHTLSVTTGNYVTHISLGLALQAQGNLAAAIMEFQQATRINPGSKNAHNALGMAFDSIGDLDSAIREYQLALQIDSTFKEASNNLGIALAGRGYLNAAIQELQRAVVLNPNNSEVHFNLGLAHERKGNPGEAIREYREALRLNPSNRKAQTGLGQLPGADKTTGE